MSFTSPEKRRRYNREYYARKHKSTSETGIAGKTEKKILFTTRLPVTLVGRMQAIVNKANADGSYPWRTMTACATALLTGGLEGMKHDPFIAEQLEQIHLTENVKRFAQLRTEAQATLSFMRTEINELLAIKAKDHALRAYMHFRDDVNEMSETVWNGWLLGSLKKAYPQLERESETADIAFKIRPQRKDTLKHGARTRTNDRQPKPIPTPRHSSRRARHR